MKRIVLLSCVCLGLGFSTLVVFAGWQNTWQQVGSFVGKSSGLVIREVRLYDRTRSDKQELFRTTGLQVGESLLSFSPHDVRERLRALRWVSDARVQRYWSGLVSVSVREHNPIALWQDGENLVALSREGAPIETGGFTPFEGLFHLSGKEAPARLEELLQITAHWPELRAHIRQAHLTEHATWQLTLRSGTKVYLSREPLVRNVVQLLRLERHYGILAAPPLLIDLRGEDRASIRAISADAKGLVEKMRRGG